MVFIRSADHVRQETCGVAVGIAVSRDQRERVCAIVRDAKKQMPR